MRKKEAKKKRAATPLTEYSDEEDDMQPPPSKKTKPEMKSARGVHHPKFYLLFERSGSLVVIVTSSNLTPQNSTEGSWIQRFEPRSSAPKLSYVQNGCGGVTRSGIDNKSASVVDFGMPSDFGVVLQDFLTKQAEAAEEGSLSPDVFLRRYVPGLSLGLSSLADQYRFEEAQVHTWYRLFQVIISVDCLRMVIDPMQHIDHEYRMVHNECRIFCHVCSTMVISSRQSLLVLPILVD